MPLGTFLLALLPIDRLPAQQPTGVLEARVVSAATGAPVPAARVEVVGTRRAGETGDDGRVVLGDVPAGVWGVRVRAIGFTPVVQGDVAVGTGKPATVLVRLTPTAVDLATVEVRASYFVPPVDASTSAQTLGAEAVRRAPGVQEDVVRAVALLPGVGVTQPGRNDLVVRGGAPFENLFLVDGLEVPNINHFGTQGSTGGPLSLINIDLVQSASFASGGFGVAYGDRTASVTDIRLREGIRERFGGEVNVSATGASLILEGPLGGDGSIVASARRSYLDLLFRAAGFSFVPAYVDLQVKATQRWGERDRLSFLLVGANGTVDFQNADADDRYDNSRVTAPEQRQYFSGLAWQRLLPGGVLDVSLGRTWTRYRTVQYDSANPPQPVFQAYSTEGENTLRAALALQPSPTLQVTVGAHAKYASTLDYDVTLPGDLRRDEAGVPRPLAVDTTFRAWRQATWLQGAWTVRERLTLTAGARGDWYAFLDDAYRVSPRAGARLALDDGWSLTASAGRYWQAPSYIWLVGDPSNAASLRPFRADQVVAGVERLLRDDLKVQIEAYVKRYDAYPAREFRPQAVLAPSGFDDVTNDIPLGLEPLANAGTGQAHGVELFAQKQLSEIPVYGLASVSWQRNDFRALDGKERPGAFDARWITTLLAGWRPGPAWELSGKYRFSSGLPTTPYLTEGPDAGRLDFTRYNAGPRLPSVHALDLRADRRWSFSGWQLSAYLDFQNVTGRENVSGYRWDPRTRMVEAETSIGFLPSIGINVEW